MTRLKSITAFLHIAAIAMLAACTGKPDNVEPVTGFDLDRYLGTWYEIARLDHSFERGLESITANYTLREDGGVRVLNRGYNVRDGAWEEIEGKAYFVADPDKAHLKVSFFGPFYGSYIVFELGENYQYAFISGPDTDYLWLLARTPEVDREVLDLFLERAGSLGFDTGKLIYVDHSYPVDGGSEKD
jgi:apolipoprotein D and lipocalin family protein